MRIRWSGSTHDPVRYGRLDGEVVAQIYTLATHTHLRRNSDVYAVSVRGNELTERYRYVDEAKRAVLEHISSLAGRI